MDSLAANSRTPAFADDAAGMLRLALAADTGVRDGLAELRAGTERPDLSLLRVLDIVVWMRNHGSAAGRPEREPEAEATA